MGSVSIVFPLIILQGAISQTVGGGASSIVSRLLGKNDACGAGKVTFNAMFVFYTTVFIITVFGLLSADSMLSVLGVTEELFKDTKKYYSILLLGSVFSTGFSSIIRAEGKMIYSLIIWIIPALLNILLDAIFIVLFKWGVEGSAGATVISWFVSFLMSVLFFTRYSVQNFNNIRFDKKIIAEIISIGLPTFIQMSSLSIMTIIMNNILNDIGGTESVNIFAYVSKIMQFCIIPFTAFGLGVAPIIGFSYGAGEKTRSKKAMKLGLVYCEIYAALLLIILFYFPSMFVKIFTNNEEMIIMISNVLKTVCLSLLFIPIPLLLGSYYQAIGKKNFAFLFYISTPLMLLFIIFVGYSIINTENVWCMYNVSNILSAFICLIIHLFYNIKNKTKTDSC